MPQSFIPKSFFALAFSTTLFGASLVQTPASLTVHEWGTFTSVAGYDGKSLTWAPLSVAGDLPCFVHTLANSGRKYLPGLVRMETPVVYFYTQQATTATVSVDFPQGEMTEWYPAARVTSNSGLEGRGGIEWADLKIQPGTNPALLTTKGESHYFPARETDAVPLVAGGENEKLLFYRGLANFHAPLLPVPAGNGYEIQNTSGTPMTAILFENHDGKIGYRVIRDLKDSVRVDAPPLTRNVDAIRKELAGMLVQSGLYQKEADAMLTTWHDSWFEAGTRVIYIDPRSLVDEILPMRISPAPQNLERVFVGRIEVLSPSTETAIRSALESGNLAAIQKLGRFLPAFHWEMMKHGKLSRSTPGEDVVGRIDSVAYRGDASCIR